MPSLLAWIYAFVFTLDYFLTGSLAMLGKSHMFMRHPVLGRMMGMSPEAVMRESDPAFHSPEVMDGFKEAVLIGNYGGMGPPQNKRMMKFGPAKKKIGAMAGRAMVGMQNATDPNSLMELRDGHQYPYSVVMNGIRLLMEEQNKIKSRSAGKGGKGESTLMSCLSKLGSCAMLPVSNVQCYLECMLNASPTLKRIRHVLVHKLVKLCEPIGTIFEKVIERLENQFPEIKRLEHFMQLFDVPPEHYKAYASKGAGALMMQIAFNIGKPFLAGHRRSMRPLKRSLGLADKSFKVPHSMVNEGCKNISLMEGAKQVVDMLEKKPQSSDMMLGGYQLARSIALNVPGPHQLVFSAFYDVITLITGVPCGIIVYAETGEKVECEQKSDETEPVVLPDEYKGPDPYKGACGTIPEFPSFDMNMGFKFPKMDANANEE